MKVKVTDNKWFVSMKPNNDGKQSIEKFGEIDGL